MSLRGKKLRRFPGWEKLLGGQSGGREKKQAPPFGRNVKPSLELADNLCIGRKMETFASVGMTDFASVGQTFA